MVNRSKVTSTMYHEEQVSTADMITSAIPHDMSVHGS